MQLVEIIKPKPVPVSATINLTLDEIKILLRVLGPTSYLDTGPLYNALYDLKIEMEGEE